MQCQIGQVDFLGNKQMFTAIWNQHAFYREQVVCFERKLEGSNQGQHVLAVVTQVLQDGGRWFKVNSKDHIPPWGQQIFNHPGTDLIKKRKTSSLKHVLMIVENS